MKIEDIIARVEALTGPDRDLDADIAEHVYGWKPARVAADYDGKNSCEVLTENGKLPKGFEYPPRGVIHRAYHVPEFTRDTRDDAVPRDYIRKALLNTLRDIAARKARRG